MKKNLFIACCFCISIIPSCSKLNKEVEKPTNPKEYNVSVNEIGLQLKFSFERTNPDNFQIKLSDNFSLTQSSSLYNMERNSEFFFLNCKRILDGQSYLVYCNIDSSGKIDITHAKANF